MNAVDPAVSIDLPRSAHSSPGDSDAVTVPELAFVDRSAALTGWLAVLYGAGVAALAGLWLAARAFPAIPQLAGVRTGGVAGLALASLLLAFAGLTGTWMVAWARRRAAAASPTPRAANRWRWARIRLPTEGDPSLIGRMARWPQAILMTGLAPLSMACAWTMASGVPASPDVRFLAGGVATVLAFPLLIAERLLAATPASHLPEAPSLRALLLPPVLVIPAAGLVSIATGLGIPFAPRIDALLAAVLTLIVLELWLRALGRCFLPPPAPGAARAAVESTLARMIAEGVRTRSLNAPVRQHLGIDFSRGWALSFLRSAIPPAALLMLLLSWGLSGVVLVGLDRRAVYERFGAPVAVLHPGLHVILPWPLGQVRRVEFGVVREIALIGPDVARSAAGTSGRLVGAEDPAPQEADRLWEQAHPGELTFLIASGDGSRIAGGDGSRIAGGDGSKQSFQIVSADIKVRYRIGMTDRDALFAAYRVADPSSLLRAAASRVMATFFSGRTLDTVLGENREAMAGRLRARLQRDLDRFEPGIELSAVVIEAIHPPAGAAEAYHAVRAAEIQAVTSISSEQGHAIATRARASQYATDIVNEARASGAEATGVAESDLTRFTADHAAAMAGGESFLLERRLTALAASLTGKTLTIIDHRIPVADAPVLDLRPLSPATARSAGADQE